MIYGDTVTKVPLKCKVLAVGKELTLITIVDERVPADFNIYVPNYCVFESEEEPCR